MKTASPLARLVFCGLVVGLVGQVMAQERMRGPLPPEQRAAIAFLAEHHKELKREVTLSDDGYTATTTSENAEVSKRLREHFAYMKKRMESGAMVRRWDPAFVEMVQYHYQIKTEVTELENGIRVKVTGTTPEGVQVARNHAKIISEFVKRGFPAVHEPHETAVNKDGK